MDVVTKTIEQSGDIGIALWVTGDTNRRHIESVLTPGGWAHHIPKLDHLLALRESGKEMIDHLGLKIAGEPIVPNNLDRKSVGVEFVRKIPGMKRNQHISVFSIAVVERGPGDFVATILDVNAAQAPTLAVGLQAADDLIDRLYQNRCSTLEATQLTTTLRDIILHSFHGTRLKGNGGCYFIPPQFLREYEAIARGIEASPTSAKFTLFEFKLAPNSTGFRAIMDGISDEINSGVEAITAELGSMNSTGVKMRRDGIESRLSRLTGFCDKVRFYEALLGQTMPSLHTAIEAAEGGIGLHKMLSLSAE